MSSNPSQIISTQSLDAAVSIPDDHSFNLTFGPQGVEPIAESEESHVDVERAESEFSELQRQL